jgi:NAD(P)H-nitrite reductase large subunit
VDGLGDEVGRAADGDEVDGVELADGGDGFRPALGLAEQAGLDAARVMVVGAA